MDNNAKGNFLETIVAEDLAAGRVQTVVTRFPPEPNGYLHIGHAKSISVNFGLAETFGGRCNLRFDDTNPEKESQAYIDSIQEDVRWLGYSWDGEVRFASSYFQQLYDWAVHLVENGHAYVCDLNAEQAREYRGTLTEPGSDSPYRERSVAENLDLLSRMKAGEFADGEKVLRAKIDMASPNMNMRDPILYRIRKVPHHQTGDTWVIYPTYDFAHGQEDAIEGVTHSVCTLEFEDHRPLYDWILDHLPVSVRPRQFEFGRLNPSYTITSKRKLKQLVDDAVVAGWDDPRMPTVAGMRRRGYTPAAIRKFCQMIGTTRGDGVVDVAMLEFAIREDLNENAPRAMCVLNPLKVVLLDYPEGQVEEIVSPRHPSREELGERVLPFTRELYIDADDFREEANKKYKRLVLGKRVRLRNAYVIEAVDTVKDDAGHIVEVHARTIAGTLGNNPEDGIKPKGVIQWVSASEGRQATVRLYDRLFNHESPDKGDRNFLEHVNPDSLHVVEGAWVEPSLVGAVPEQGFQFEREGYFVADRYDHSQQSPVFNRTIGLRDSWGEQGGSRVMSLHLYNTLGGSKQLFEPLVPDTVTMYVCGPTVYNLAHIGNARPVVVFDILFRLLQTHYETVTYARNITDVDDKIIAAAREGGRSIESVTDEFTAKYREDMAQLNALPPTLEPHATHNIGAMLALTATLIEKGHAYESAGHVLFAVESMADYGTLSHRSLDDMLAGARVEVADYKRHPGDFVMWKPAAEDEPGWDSPWGRGRPGWHLECSAMIHAHLGDTIDIHGGGRDLIFPHHENEIAQSRCAHGGDYVRYWMHNAYLDIDGEKMSKSLGNFRTVRDLLQSYRGEVLRFALLSAHYRSPLNFSAELLDQAETTLGSLYSTLREVQDIELDVEVPLADEPFYRALNDDLNTPVAIAEIHALARQLHKASAGERPVLKARILAAGDLLGILQQDPQDWLQGGVSDDAISADAIEALIDERQASKLAKDYARADEIRQELLAQGVVLEDSREGTKWRRE